MASAPPDSHPDSPPPANDPHPDQVIPADEPANPLENIPADNGALTRSVSGVLQ